jgi:hypothetical protein
MWYVLTCGKSKRFTTSRPVSVLVNLPGKACYVPSTQAKKIPQQSHVSHQLGDHATPRYMIKNAS